MAYISQEEKKELAPGIKAVLKKYGVKGTIAVRGYSSLVVNIKSGVLDLMGDCGLPNEDSFQVNPYYAEERAKDPKIGSFYGELLAAMKGTKWYNNSDAQIDYFDIAYYVDINVGKWDTGYVYNGEGK
tara:strand:+ start:112 stop:495 length:384 start_codon:yes stop_codon:yes gene_type:complete